MTTKAQVYKCEKCGNVVEVVHPGEGTLVCCGEPMKCMVEQTAEQAKEKHVPVLQKTADSINVVVGSTLHPMIDTHYIEWIELVTETGIHRKYLKPGFPPEAVFDCHLKVLQVREYCNIHGLWVLNL
jgi:superoxide reductase